MVHRLRRSFVIGGLLLALAPSATSQTSRQVAMADGNAQRSRVLATRGLETPPQQLLWESERLFQLRTSYPFSAQTGGLVLRGDLPTGYTVTFPIISEGILFFTLYVDNAYFYAVDAQTGKQLVTLKFDANRLSGPAAIGQIAYFGTASGKVYAYDVPTRKMKWVFDGEGSFSYSPPAIDDGIIYMSGTEEGVVALAADTGAVKWKVKSDQVLYRPAVKGDDVVVYGVKGLLMSLDKKTGNKKWETKLGREFTGTAILDDQIFLSHVNGEIRAYALADGTLRWKSNKDGGTQTALALFKDSVIYGEEYGNIVALDARSGAPKWKFKTNKPCRSPIVAGEIVYTSCSDHFLYAVNAQTGDLKWKLDGKRSGPLPLINDGVMYFLAGREGIMQAIK